MALLHPSELRDRFETGVSDVGLEDLIEAEEARISELFGSGTAMVEVFDHYRPTNFSHLNDRITRKRLVLRRPAVSVEQVTETVGITDTVLAASDYEVLKRYQLQRLATGSNPRGYWGDRVRVEYTAENDSAMRKQVLIQLCRIALVENGYLIEKTPEFTFQAVEDTNLLRQQALNRLRRKPLLI